VDGDTDGPGDLGPPDIAAEMPDLGPKDMGVDGPADLGVDADKDGPGDLGPPDIAAEMPDLGADGGPQPETTNVYACDCSVGASPGAPLMAPTVGFILALALRLQTRGRSRRRKP
jgi:hypothetical protein